MVTENWETLSEIKKRTGAKADDVISGVQEAFQSGIAECRFEDRAGVKIAEWKLKESGI